MRVSMSAIGSVSTSSSSFLPSGARVLLPLVENAQHFSRSLPGRLGHAGDRALMREIPQADPAEPELPVHGARAPAAVAAAVLPRPVALRPRRLDDERLLGHLSVSPVFCERKAEPAEECPRVLVGVRGGGDGDVEPADARDGVVVDLGEDDLLADAERVVAAAVEGARAEAPEVADARERDRDQAIEELVHARATKCDLRADRHSLA